MATKYNTNYLKFDAFSIKRLLTQKFSDDPTFTDQIYDGSNLSVLIDVFSYMFQTLMYYINHSASEAILSDSQLYENINRLVKTFGYNPVGYLTSVSEFNILAYSDGNDQARVLPKYSTITSNIVDENGEAVSYSTINNHTLYSRRNAENFAVLYNGKWKLYERTFISDGIPYERFVLSNLISDPDNQKYISYPHLAVFVKGQNGWKIFDPIENGIFFNDAEFNTYKPTDRVFEVRIDEFRQYEIKFGDGIYGEKLNAGDEIYIAYLSSNGPSGKIGANTFTESNTKGKISIGISGLSAQTFREIFKDTNSSWITPLQISDMYAINTTASTLPVTDETPDQIRENAPKWFKTTGRLITQDDFKLAVFNQFSSNIIDVKIMNNWELANSLYRWLYGMEVKTGQKYLTNNMAQRWGYPWADACDFNNIYVLIKMENLTDLTKKYIKRAIDPFKPLTSEIVFIDPYTTYFVPCALSVDEIQTRKYSIFDGQFSPTTENSSFSENYIEVLVDSKSLVSPEIVKSSVVSEISNFFSTKNQKIGATIDLNLLNSNLLNIAGVSRIRTIYKNDNLPESVRVPPKIVSGLQFAYWTSDIIEGQDMTSTGASVKLEEFQFAELYLPETLGARVKIVTSQIFSSLESDY